MARHPRLIVPGIALHINQRGNDRQACFREDSDQLVYLAKLREFCKHWRCALHAYCLMTNHVHLLLTPEDERGPALLMRDLGRCYVRYYNDRHGRTGSLWEGRFHSCLVDSPQYVIACHRYLERNPVRAHMVDAPGAYRWSSYAGNSGARRDVLLTPHPEYRALGIEERSRFAAYAALCREEDEGNFLSAIRHATEGGLPLIGDDLKVRLTAQGLRVDRAKPGPRPKSEEDQPQNLELEI